MNSGNLRHINRDKFKSPVCYLCLLGCVVTSLSLAQEVVSRVDLSVKFQRKDQSVKRNAYFYYFGRFRVFPLYI